MNQNIWIKVESIPQGGSTSCQVIYHSPTIAVLQG